MSAAIGPGDWVECVDASPFEGEPSPLEVGRRYQIAAVWDFLPHKGDGESNWYDCSLDLVGVPSPREDLAWGLYRFRPIGSESLLKQIKASTPELEVVS